MNSGKFPVSHAFVGCVALLAATAAACVGEHGSDAMLVGPELAAPRPRAITCADTSDRDPRQIQFGMLQPGEADDLPRILAAGARQAVAFEWHAPTGELTLSGTTSGVFSDLESAATRNAPRLTRSCGSR